MYYVAPTQRKATSMTNTMSLPEAAKRLSISWERAWRALLIGDLDGEKRNGRWYVTARSVCDYERRVAARVESLRRELFEVERPSRRIGTDA
jgi:hypothetical protein